MTSDPRSGAEPPPEPATPGAQRAAGRSAGGGPPVLLEQAFDSQSLYALRAAVAAHAAAAGLPPARADDLVVAVHELAANSIRHGAGCGRVRLWREDQELRAEVIDAGPPLAAAGSPDGPRRVAAARWPIEHGHGLWLAREVADQISLHSGSGGSTATVSFRLRRPG